MNLADAVAFAQSGKTVLVIPESRTATDALFESHVEDAELEGVAAIRRTAGHESVRFANGGRVRFISAGSARLGGARGHRADLLLVDDAALPDERLDYELEPVTSDGGTRVVADLR